MLRAAKLAPSKAAASRPSSDTPNRIVKEADRSTGQSSKGAKVQAATIDPRGEAVPCAPGEADLMDTQPPSPKRNSEAGKSKGLSSKGAGVKTVAINPQGETAPSAPGEAGLRETQPSIITNNKLSTSPLAHHLAALRQVFGMSPPLDDLEPGEIRSESETDFTSPAKQAKSAVNVATLAMATPASFAYEGSARPSSSRSSRAKSILVSALEDVASGVAPSVEQLSFTLTTVSASSTTARASTVKSE